MVGCGETWERGLEDVEWDDGDVLVVGSSSIGPVARVFLGSRATKIVRHSPVPVVVVPRDAEGRAELARGEAARRSAMPAQRLADDAVGDQRREVGACRPSVGITSTTSAPIRSSSAATVRTASSSSVEVIPPGSGVPVAGR